MESKEKQQYDLIEKTSQHLKSIEIFCKEIISKKPTEINHKEYILLVMGYDIFFKAKDILSLSKIKLAENDAHDSSLYILTRSVLETYFYLKYLISEDSKVTTRLNAFICHTNQNNIKTFNCLLSLGKKGKFVFSEEQDNILSLHMLNKRKNEWGEEIQIRLGQVNFPSIQKEMKIFEKVEEVAKKYDEVKKITRVQNGSENESLEWMYNYVYRFQSMSVHQSLSDKEKVFSLFDNKNTQVNNLGNLGLLET